MNTITISSSSRYYPEAQELATSLTARGYVVLTPRFEFDETQIVVGPAEKASLTAEFLAKVANADLLVVNCVDGYVGLSVSLEIGYASALGIPILFVQEPTELAFRGLGSVGQIHDGNLVLPTSFIGDAAQE